MKKILLATILFVILALFATTMVNATTSAELPTLIYNKGSKYEVTEGHKVKMERFLERHPATDAQADAVMAKVDEVVTVFENAKVDRLSKLSSADLKRVQEISTEAAAILNIKLVWKGTIVELYYNGKLEDTLDFSGKAAYTGNDTNIALVVSSVAVVALAAGFIARKKLANA